MTHAIWSLSAWEVIDSPGYPPITARGRESRAVAEANNVLVKPNHSETTFAAFATLHFAIDTGTPPVVSARSGETEQDWLVDLAVGTGAGQIKVGSTHRSERTAKWNRLPQLSAQASLPYTTTTQ